MRLTRPVAVVVTSALGLLLADLRYDFTATVLGSLSVPDLDALALLTPAKQAAVEALATGSSQTEAAVLAGVGRECVNRWCNHDAAFGAALAEYRAVLVIEQA